MSEQAGETSEFQCPACGGAILIAPADVELIIACPLCHTDLTVPPAESENYRSEDASDDRDDELDHGRISQRATLRRALYRSRSYAIIAAVVCAVAVMQLGVSSYHAMRSPAIAWAAIYIALMFAAIIGAVYFYRRAMAFHQEAKQSELRTDPQTPPDFTALGDGREPWEKLNDVR